VVSPRTARLSTRKRIVVTFPAFQRLLTARLVQSEWCVCCGSDPSLACFQTPRESQKAEMTSPVPIPKKPSLSRQSKKNNTIHGCLFVEGKSDVEVRCVDSTCCVLSVVGRRVWREAHILLVCGLVPPLFCSFSGPFDLRRCRPI